MFVIVKKYVTFHYYASFFIMPTRRIRITSYWIKGAVLNESRTQSAERSPYEERVAPVRSTVERIRMFY